MQGLLHGSSAGPRLSYDGVSSAQRSTVECSFLPIAQGLANNLGMLKLLWETVACRVLLLGPGLSVVVQ